MSTVDDADQEIAEDPAPPRPPRALLVASIMGLALAFVVLGVLAIWLVRSDPSLLQKSLGPILTSLLFLLLGDVLP